ncbi:hypothetical protein J7K19_04000 [bacterium]|nr:hypothetical protein [bacterium]
MKRKKLGMTAAITVIISLLIVNVPAEEKEDKKDCGCGCNKAPAQGEPLDFDKVLEKTVGWEEKRNCKREKREKRNKREEKTIARTL